ncbi:hypothetical protein [Pseudooceanicola sp.]|uniref:hypothetical protein n=1 Tax=Pseudooceanicola sp. TaxID=1914328 RepID=UPI00260C27CE|nr:hypothetical protein [Pseudooceanicola sp.]MDF1855331.1 hypothetical protein [Pseudooceanicola sp.]
MWSATPEEAARAAYHHPGPPALTLYTIVSNETGSGVHTSLMVNASQRVLFDPAGSFHHESAPRVGDVIYGITPSFEKAYESMHARETHHVVAQRVEVTPEVAETALRLVTSNGAVPQAQCAASTASVLRQVPGFEALRQTTLPKLLRQSFAEVTGVAGRTYYEEFTPPSG